MVMPGRSFSAASQYRYGFNGQEKSEEIGHGLTTATYWEYDSRIGRRWNVDPVLKEYESPYLCFSGNPIWLSDVNGDNPGKGYNWTATKKWEDVQIAAIRIAYNTLVERQVAKDFNWDKNAQYRIRATVLASGYDLDKGSGFTKSQFIGAVNDYYKVFESAFNWSANETVSALTSTLKQYNNYSGDDASYQRFAIHVNYSLIDGILDGPQNIIDRCEIVFYKCAIFASIWATSGVGSGVGFSNLIAPGLSPNRVPLRTVPRMPVGRQSISLKYADAQPNGVSFSYTLSGGKLSINGRPVTNGKFDYVITNSGELKIGSGHYYLSGGAESVQAAGRLKIYKGTVTPLNGNSGHYRPTPEQTTIGNNLLKEIINGGN